MLRNAPTQHQELLSWISEMAQMCNPDKIVWIDGSNEQKQALTKEALAIGEILELNQEKLPGCYYHRTAINDVARTEHLTYICTKRKDDAGPNNNWMLPLDAYAKAASYFKNSMQGRTMYVIPFSMGPVGSPFSKIGVELTDSIYVVLNMLIMTRAGKSVLKKLGKKGSFTKCLHSKANLDIEKRLILHFPEDNTIWSVNSGYGGNVLLGKKCLSLRIGSYLGFKEGWMAEHMLIMGIEYPNGKIEYIAAAFPSACGKTNLAMLIPPDGLKSKGYRIWTVGDDIAWMQIDSDGRLWAVNPENGFFGVAPGTNSHTNPNAMETIKKDTIFTNVLLKPDKTVWWEGHDDPPPNEGINWKGEKWQPGQKDKEGKEILGAHANARFTAPLNQCPSISNRVEHHHGVPISAIIFGGRRITTAPLVYQAYDWQHGVFIGATMASERTAAQFGKQGEVRRDPMAMLPFCGYHMGDYFKHWLKMGKKMGENAPKIFHVNWFKQDENNKFIWPGFRENLRVLEWVIRRAKEEVPAQETAIGFIPNIKDIDMTGLNLPAGNMEKLFKIDKNEWQTEVSDIREFFKTFGDKLPKELNQELTKLEERL